METSNLKSDERAVSALRGLYAKYGYRQYKMSKFEEYDLYVKNKNFLVSDSIITFTDTDGKLMALKPDVTLSIIKNTRDVSGFLQKVYYNENVYRVSKGTGTFKEIMQTGLECIGDIDGYCIYEVLMLALESLASISEDYILDISHLGIVSGIIDSLNISAAAERELLTCISEKNIHGIREICSRENADPGALIKLVSACGAPGKIIPQLREIVTDDAALGELASITSLLSKAGFEDKIRIDFSVINHMGYYNGFVFSGFINGLAAAVLSGGQYDGLMHKMGRSSGAIGFAVYLDMLEQLTTGAEYDVDTVILYDGTCGIEALSNAVALFTANGKSVTAQKALDGKLKYRQLVRLTQKGVDIIETNA